MGKQKIEDRYDPPLTDQQQYEIDLIWPIVATVQRRYTRGRKNADDIVDHSTVRIVVTLSQEGTLNIERVKTIARDACRKAIVYLAKDAKRFEPQAMSER